MLFRCLRSGNTVNIDQQDDIDRMMHYEGYECVERTERIEPSIQSVTYSVGEDHGLQETQNAVEEAGVPEEEVVAVEPVAKVAPVKRRGRPAKVEVVGEL